MTFLRLSILAVTCTLSFLHVFTLDSACAAEDPILDRLPPIKLSANALQLLVSGVAFYPNDTLTLILDASTHPIELHLAAGEADRNLPPPPPLAKQANQPESIKRLEADSPDTLRQLDETLVLTVALGLAYRSQPDDVWTAVEAVRQHSASTSADNSNKGDDAVQGSDLVTALLQSPATQELADKISELCDNSAKSAQTQSDGGTAAGTSTDTAIAAARAAALTRGAVRPPPQSRIPAYNVNSKAQFAAGQRALKQNWNKVAQKVVKPGVAFKVPQVGGRAPVGGGGGPPPFGRR